MKLRRVSIHHFRGILEASFPVQNYSIIVGANNGGKSTIIDAIRCFYEKESFKFDKKEDVPKGIPDGESEPWVELLYEPDKIEFQSLKDSYQKKSPDGFLRLRKYFLGNSNRKPGIYFVSMDGEVATELFYGTKNVQDGKIGDIIYIPAVSYVDEIAKLNGPSALRDMLNGIMGSVVEGSGPYLQLTDSINRFSESLQSLKTEDNHSLDEFCSEVNDNLSPWKAQFEIKMRSPSSSEIIKNMLDWELADTNLSADKKIVDVERWGSGFQRFFIFSLVRLSSKYILKSVNTKTKDFCPSLTLVLFEEPEAFLHPEQQDELARDLKRLSESENWQVVCTTHSSHFVSKSMDDIPSIVRVQREHGVVKVFNVDDECAKRIFSSNIDYGNFFDGLPEKDRPQDKSMELESLKYSMWLDPNRAGLFFASKVILVEGPSEVVLVAKLVSEGKLSLPSGTQIVDCFGKFNIHRFISLLDNLGISHAVLHDTDDNDKQRAWNAFVQAHRGKLTTHIETLNKDLESFLNVEPAPRTDRKPLSLLEKYSSGKIDETRIEAFIQLMKKLAE